MIGQGNPAFEKCYNTKRMLSAQLMNKKKKEKTQNLASFVNRRGCITKK